MSRFAMIKDVDVEHLLDNKDAGTTLKACTFFSHYSMPWDNIIIPRPCM